MDKVLGVAYSFQSDMFAAKIGTKAEVDVKTRRQMLSLIHSVFDPLGFIAPATLKGRIMFQSATSLGLDWDDKLPDYLVKEFNEWREKINQLESILPLEGPRASQAGFRTSQAGLRASQSGPRDCQAGFRASEAGLRAS